MMAYRQLTVRILDNPYSSVSLTSGYVGHFQWGKKGVQITR